MKNTTLMIVLCLSLIGCNKLVEESQLIGKWKVTEFNADTPGLSSEVIESAREEAISMECELSSGGGSFLKSNYFDKGQKGKWVFDQESKRNKHYSYG